MKSKKRKKKKGLALFMDGKICPYCGDETLLVEDEEIYNQSYGGMAFVCWPCGAWVGCHKGTDKALGRLANKELRAAKILAHDYFDKLWRRKQKEIKNKHIARSKAYKWLAKEMDIDKKHTHIGMFNVEQCEKVVLLCKPYIK